jgi:hypothetical protein
MVRSLSSLSVPASINSLTTFADKNVCDSPVNHPFTVSCIELHNNLSNIAQI